MPDRPIPDGYHTVTPYLTVAGVPALLEFTKAAFGAEEVERVLDSAGVIRHAEVRIGDSIVMMGEARSRADARPATLYLYLPDVDAAFPRAAAAAAKVVMPPTDMFYGDRAGAVEDPCGNSWWLASRVQTLSAEELARRAAEPR